MNAREWIALAAVVVSLLTPIAIVFFGFMLNKRLKYFEQSVEREKRLADARFGIYKEIGLKLNDIYAYFFYVGLWKKLSCDEILDRKRELDRHMYTYEPLFSSAVIKSYHEFINSAFATYQGRGKDAKLKTKFDDRPERDYPDKHKCFTNQENTEQITKTYKDLMEELARDLSLSRTSVL